MHERDEKELDLNLSLLEKIRKLYAALRDEMQKKWKRDLPFEELLFNRWDRAKQLGFGEGASIYHNSYVYGDVQVGENTWIGPNCILEGSGGPVSVGDYCSVASGVHIYTHDAVKWAVTGGKTDYEKAPTTIGNCCYIGPFSVITKGVTIGKHSIIGAFSLVNKDIPEFSVAWGQPARVVGNIRIKNGTEIEVDYI